MTQGTQHKINRLEKPAHIIAYSFEKQHVKTPYCHNGSWQADKFVYTSKEQSLGLTAFLSMVRVTGWTLKSYLPWRHKKKRKWLCLMRVLDWGKLWSAKALPFHVLGSGNL